MKNLQRVAEDNCNCVALLCFLDSHCRWHGSYDCIGIVVKYCGCGSTADLDVRAHTHIPSSGLSMQKWRKLPPWQKAHVAHVT